MYIYTLHEFSEEALGYLDQLKHVLTAGCPVVTRTVLRVNNWARQQRAKQCLNQVRHDWNVNESISAGNKRLVPGRS